MLIASDGVPNEERPCDHERSAIDYRLTGRLHFS
jgi:hypothetical protein